MSVPKLINWINKNDEEQCFWAVTYLGKRGFFLLYENNESHHTHLVRVANNFHDNEVGSLRRYMRDAWRQRKHQSSKKDHKTLSFNLPNKAQSELSLLAKSHKLTKGQMIEALLSDAFEMEKTLSKKYEDEITRLKEAVKKKNAKSIIELTKKNNDTENNKKITKLEQEVEALKAQVNTAPGQDPSDTGVTQAAPLTETPITNSTPESELVDQNTMSEPITGDQTSSTSPTTNTANTSNVEATERSSHSATNASVTDDLNAMHQPIDSGTDKGIDDTSSKSANNFKPYGERSFQSTIIGQNKDSNE